ncbi:hypothetical protein DFR42_105170 [Undibacterium pigrum]|uniref:Uncharacterized protein n=1 Tax=Undibacterium pigrum TaxID=401470 RepID=A0A318J5T9_9BURK|nr:hypothetical protein DFR42_105170 [Undibacterium pigrum]
MEASDIRMAGTSVPGFQLNNVALTDSFLLSNAILFPPYNTAPELAPGSHFP